MIANNKQVLKETNQGNHSYQTCVSLPRLPRLKVSKKPDRPLYVIKPRRIDINNDISTIENYVNNIYDELVQKYSKDNLPPEHWFKTSEIGFNSNDFHCLIKHMDNSTSMKPIK